MHALPYSIIYLKKSEESKIMEISFSIKQGTIAFLFFLQTLYFLNHASQDSTDRLYNAAEEKVVSIL